MYKGKNKMVDDKTKKTKQKFYVPGCKATVEAENLEEALKKVKNLKKK